MVTSVVYNDVWSRLQLDLQQYMYSTGALKAATGFCIGMATKEGIDRILAVSVHPLLLLMSEWLGSRFLSEMGAGTFSAVVQRALHILGVTLRTFIEWIVLVGVAYVTLELLFNRRIIGLSSVVPNNKEGEFVTSKNVASASSGPLA